jgi:putative flippase GtrA
MKQKQIKEICLYLLFGGLTTLVNIVSFWVLDRLLLPTALSTVIAWVLSVVFAFLTNKKYVFESKNNPFKELIAFFGCRAFSGVFDLAVMVIFVDVLKYPSMIIKILSNVVVILMNYFFSKFLIFGKKKNILCFGDSITEGMAMAREDSYPGVLASHLKSKYKIFNAGCGGENSYTIGARANALPFTFKNDVCFEKGVFEYVTDWEIFKGINGELMRLRYGQMGRDLKINRVVVGDEIFDLRFEQVGEEENDKYILTRKNADFKRVIPAGTPVRFDYTHIYDEPYCVILMAGGNDNFAEEGTAQRLVERYKNVASLCDRFIPLIPHFTGDNVAKLFYETFGDICVDLREYCKEQFWIDNNIEKDEDDIKCINNGVMSTKFTYQNNYADCHLNELGYKTLADLIYKKGQELSFWK